jgi:dihydropteroate synthase
LQAILRKNSLNCAGTLLVLDQPKIMGILNATPDSFYTESRIIEINLAVESAGKMLENGANIIDIGGQSTRPGAETVSSDLEANRVLPIIEAIHNAFPSAILSVDTFYASVARDAAKLGAGIINDVSGGDDPEMFELVGELGLPYVLMHRPGSAKEMQKLAVYEDVILDIGDYFSKKIAALQSFQVKDILIDPGFGFGKTLVQNYKLLAGLNQFKIFELPLFSLKQASKSWITWINDSKGITKSLVFENLGNSFLSYDQNGNFIKTINIGDLIDSKLRIIEIIPSTGLLIKYDPSIPIIYLGFGLLMITTSLSYLPYTQIWIYNDNKNSWIGCSTNRGKIQVEIEFENLIRYLENIISQNTFKDQP